MYKMSNNIEWCEINDEKYEISNTGLLRNKRGYLLKQVIKMDI